jgi:hypothetical protein
MAEASRQRGSVESRGQGGGPALAMGTDWQARQAADRGSNLGGCHQFAHSLALTCGQLWRRARVWRRSIGLTAQRSAPSHPSSHRESSPPPDGSAASLGQTGFLRGARPPLLATQPGFAGGSRPAKLDPNLRSQRRAGWPVRPSQPYRPFCRRRSHHTAACYRHAPAAAARNGLAEARPVHPAGETGRRGAGVLEGNGGRPAMTQWSSRGSRWAGSPMRVGRRQQFNFHTPSTAGMIDLVTSCCRRAP